MEYTSWRITFAVLAAAGALAFIGQMFLLKETLVPIGYDPKRDPHITTMSLLKQKGKRVDLVTPIFNLKYIPILTAAWLNLVTFACMSFVSVSIARDYVVVYGFNTLHAGMSYLPYVFHSAHTFEGGELTFGTISYAMGQLTGSVGKSVHLMRL